MKSNIFKYLLLLPVLLISLVACRNDDDMEANSIAINLKEVGTHANPTRSSVNAGSDLHLEADILAPNKISTVVVKIVSKTNASKVVASETYTDFAGEVRSTFHKHIDIPETTQVGSYVVSFTVTDQKGFARVVTADLEIKPSVSSLFTVEFGSVGTDGKGYIGEALAVKAHIETTNPIASIAIELHNESVSTQTLEQKFTNYTGLTHAHFSESVTIPAAFSAGDYHMHLVVKDTEGNEYEAEYELEVLTR